MPRSLFYVWRNACRREGESGLINKRPCAWSRPKTTPPGIVEKILYLRWTYDLGPKPIVWYLERYHGLEVLRRHRLPHAPP